MKIKFIPPIIFSIPTTLVWPVFLYRLFGEHPHPGFALWIMNLSFISITACIAMIFVKPESREWRYAAMYVAAPWTPMLFLWLLFYLTH